MKPILITGFVVFLIEYANVIYQIGFKKYYQEAAKAGINYILVPDAPIEESAAFVKAAQNNNIAQIFMIAPTTPNQRIKKIILTAKQTASHNSMTLPTFLYLVSVTGAIGSRKTVSQETIDFIKRVKKITDIALIVGFGISQSKHIQQVVGAGADGVVTCSPIVDIIHNQQKTPKKMFRAIGEYVRGLG